MGRGLRGEGAGRGGGVVRPFAVRCKDTGGQAFVYERVRIRVSKASAVRTVPRFFSTHYQLCESEAKGTRQ